MLKSFKITNFHSIGETQEFSLAISNNAVLDDSAYKVDEDLNINLVSTIVGHNASGKTTTIKALTFLLWFVEESYTTFKETTLIPVEPHHLKKDERTKFEIEFLSDGKLYKYSIALDKNQVFSEYLGQHIKRDFSRVFEYQRDGNAWEFTVGKSLGTINNKDMDRFRNRRNVSVLSSLIHTGYLDKIHFFENVHANVNQLGYQSVSIFSKFFNVSEKLYEDETLKEQVLDFVKNVDLGISDFRFGEAVLRSSDKPDEEITKKTLECIHGSGEKEFSLELIEESGGTIQGFNLLSSLIPILNTGGIAVLDEIEDGLHPYVVKKIISLFEKEETNPKKAQLIFATHQHLLLNDRTKTQIFFTEKDEDNFETEIYRLDDVEGVRNDENFFQKYLAGVYGATPNIKSF